MAENIDYRKYFRSGIEEIRKVLGPPDDDEYDNEYYTIDLIDGVNDEQNLRIIHNAQVEAKKKMEREKEFRNVVGYTYQKQQGNPDLWYKISISFYEASLLLYENQECVSGALRLFHFNAALSLELILKGILTAKQEKIPTIHNLVKLANLAMVDLNEDQKETLNLLHESIEWLGRYPVPIREEYWDKFHNEILEKHIVQSNTGNTYKLLSNPNRFPSKSNYLRIWEICANKYLDLSKQT